MWEGEEYSGRVLRMSTVTISYHLCLGFFLTKVPVVGPQK